MGLPGPRLFCRRLTNLDFAFQAGNAFIPRLAIATPSVLKGMPRSSKGSGFCMAVKVASQDRRRALFASKKWCFTPAKPAIFVSLNKRQLLNGSTCAYAGGRGTLDDLLALQNGDFLSVCKLSKRQRSGSVLLFPAVESRRTPAALREGDNRDLALTRTEPLVTRRLPAGRFLKNPRRMLQLGRRARFGFRVGSRFGRFAIVTVCYISCGMFAARGQDVLGTRTVQN